MIHARPHNNFLSCPSEVSWMGPPLVNCDGLDFKVVRKYLTYWGSLVLVSVYLILCAIWRCKLIRLLFLA
jgi:hypothetical protein